MARNATAKEVNETWERLSEREAQEEQYRKAHSSREAEEKEKYAQQYFTRTDGHTQFTREHFVSMREIFEVEKGRPLDWTKPGQVNVQYEGGRQTTIVPHRIMFSGGAPTDEQYREAIKYVAKHWGGKFCIRPNPDICREHRLKSLAYAEVYGLNFIDHNNHNPALALTKAELAKLPELCAHIRRVHSDAPPARPANDRVQPDAHTYG